MEDDNIVSFEVKDNQIIAKTDDCQIRVYNYNEKNIEKVLNHMKNTLKSCKEEYRTYKICLFVMKVFKECLQVAMLVSVVFAIIISESFIAMLELFSLFSLANMLTDEAITFMDKNSYNTINKYEQVQTEVHQLEKEEPKLEKQPEQTQNYHKNKIRKLKDMKEYLLSLKENIGQKPKTNIKNLKQNNCQSK